MAISGAGQRWRTAELGGSRGETRWSSAELAMGDTAGPRQTRWCSGHGEVSTEAVVAELTVRVADDSPPVLDFLSFLSYL